MISTVYGLGTQFRSESAQDPREGVELSKTELQYRGMNYARFFALFSAPFQVLFNAIWNASPIFVTLVAFWHFTVIRGETLTPSVAFTSVSRSLIHLKRDADTITNR